MANTSVQTQAATTAGQDLSTNGFRVILAWLFVLVLVFIFDKTRIGHVLMYYALCAIIFTTLLVSATSVEWILQPLTQQAPQNNPTSMPTSQPGNVSGGNF